MPMPYFDGHSYLQGTSKNPFLGFLEIPLNMRKDASLFKWAYHIDLPANLALTAVNFHRMILTPAANTYFGPFLLVNADCR